MYLKLNAENTFSRNDFTAFVGTKKQLKALENEASDLEKVREQREVCKAENLKV